MVRICVQFWPLLMALLLGAFILSLTLESTPVTLGYSTPKEKRGTTPFQPVSEGEDLNYGIIIDAGSSGSRAFVYVWPPHTGDPHQLIQIRPLLDKHTHNPVVKKISPGISSLGPNPENATVYIRPLLDFAASHIPSEKHKETSLFIMATAGLRLIPSDQSAAILKNLREKLPTLYSFIIMDQHIEMISGKWEGIYSWIAVNYALGKFKHDGIRSDLDSPQILVKEPGTNRSMLRSATVGMIDMGGGSAQIAYEIQEKVPPEQAHLTQKINLGCQDHDYEHEYRLYVTTFLGFGANSALERYENQLAGELHTKLAAKAEAAAQATEQKAPAIDKQVPENPEGNQALAQVPETAGRFPGPVANAANRPGFDPVKNPVLVQPDLSRDQATPPPLPRADPDPVLPQPPDSAAVPDAQVRARGDKIRADDNVAPKSERKIEEMERKNVDSPGANKAEPPEHMPVLPQAPEKRMKRSVPSSETVVRDPCLPVKLVKTVHLTTSAPADDGARSSHPATSFTRKGIGQWDDCKTSLKRLLKQSECTIDPCSMNGVYQPRIDFRRTKFYGFSEYWYSVEDVFSLGGKWNLQTLKEAANKFCQLKWSTLQDRYRRKLYPKADNQRMRTQCFKSAWIATVLHEGFGFPKENTNFESVSLINGQEVQWTLGAILYKLRYFPLREIQRLRELQDGKKQPFHHKPSEATWWHSYVPSGALSQLLLLVCMVVVLLAALRYFLILRHPRPYRTSSAGLPRNRSMWGYMMLGTEDRGYSLDNVRVEHSDYVY